MKKNPTIQGSQKTKINSKKNTFHSYHIDKDLIFLIYKELAESVRKRTTRRGKNKVH